MPAIVGLKRLHGALMQCWRKLMRFEPLWYLKTLSLKGVDLPDAIDYSCRARRPNLRRPPGSKRLPPRSAERAVPRKGRPLFLTRAPGATYVAATLRAHENSTSAARRWQLPAPRRAPRGARHPAATTTRAAPSTMRAGCGRFLLGAASLPSVISSPNDRSPMIRTSRSAPNTSEYR